MNLDDLKPIPALGEVVVFGAGPSAPRFYEYVEQHHHVVAPSTMLLPLQAAGIDVDYTCIMDPGAIMPLHFRGADTSGTLVYLPSIVRRCYQDWAGPKYMVWDLPGSSVLHLCVDVALRLGASEITLIGADFNFGTSRHSHASGVVTSYPVTKRMTCVNERGEEVWTESSLVEFAAQLEQQIAKRPDVHWRRMGRDGIPIAGCEVIGD